MSRMATLLESVGLAFDFEAVKLENEVIIVLNSVSTIILCKEKCQFSCILRENSV